MKRKKQEAYRTLNNGKGFFQAQTKSNKGPYRFQGQLLFRFPDPEPTENDKKNDIFSDIK